MLFRSPDLGLPYPLSEASIDVQPLPSAPGKLLLAATSREVVQAWIEVFDLAGLNLDRLAAPQSCRLSAVRPLLEEVPPGHMVVMLSPMGTRGRPLMAIRDGIPLFERTLVEQGDRLYPEIQRSIAFLRREFPDVRAVRLFMEGPVEERKAMEAALEQPVQQVDLHPFASVLLAGLAIPEPVA